jgi:hypothetical protein
MRRSRVISGETFRSEIIFLETRVLQVGKLLGLKLFSSKHINTWSSLKNLITTSSSLIGFYLWLFIYLCFLSVGKFAYLNSWIPRCALFMLIIFSYSCSTYLVHIMHINLAYSLAPCCKDGPLYIYIVLHHIIFSMRPLHRRSVYRSWSWKGSHHGHGLIVPTPWRRNHQSHRH